MTNKIVQKVCGLAASAVMALSGIAGPAADVWADEPAALAGAGSGENVLAEEPVALAGVGSEETIQPEEAAVLYRITLPWTEHLIMEPETDHIFIPDPDTRTEEEKKDILLTYEAGEEVEIGIRAEETWQITKLSFLDENKEENGYEWKDSEAVHFYMPEKDLTMQAELTGIEIPAEEQSEVAQGTDSTVNAGTDPIQQGSTATEVDPQSTPQGGDQSAEPQNGIADPAAISDTGATQNGAQNTGIEAGTAQADGSGTDAAQDTGVGTDASQDTGVEAGAVQDTGRGTGFSTEPGSVEDQVQNSENGTGSDSATETEPTMTYVPEKEADGLPVQGSIEQTKALEVVVNDAGFDAKIDLRNVPYDASGGSGGRR